MSRLNALSVKISQLFESISVAFPDESIEQPPNKLLSFCLFYSKGLFKPLLVTSLLSAILAILEVSLVGFMGQIVDWLKERDPSTFFQEEWLKLTLMSLTVLLFIPGLSLLKSLIVHQTLLGNYPMKIRWLSHRYLLKQSFSFYQNDFAGRIAAKVMQNALSVREAVLKILDLIVYIVVYFSSMLFIIAATDVRLAIPMLIWLVAYVALQRYFVPKLKHTAMEQADARSTMTGRIVDSYSNISTVKQFAHTQAEETYAKESMEGFLDTVYRQMRLATGLNMSIIGINYLLTFVTAALAIALWSYSLITVGAITVAISLVLRINSMSQWIMWEVSALFEHVGTIKDAMNTLSQPIEVKDQDGAEDIKVTRAEIDFSQVNFHYGKGSGVLENFNLRIKAGEKVGLVGLSGAGKSTLVNLLLRFFEVESGQITIDGVNINQVTQDSLRANIGIVSQDTSLLHRSVKENIGYGRLNATDEEIIEAAKKAEAHEFILELSDYDGNKGYDSQVGERGVKLSGGQRQRVSIARALLKDAPILVLDEATSALDSEVEAVIQQQLYQLMEGKTVIAIAHRLSTIAKMDRLIVLDKGQVAEMGTHEELLNHKGLYAKLWSHQTDGFLAVDLEEEVDLSK